MNLLSPILAPRLRALPGIRHGFFTRPGGVSTGMFEGLNARLGSADNTEHVLENRKRIADHLKVSADSLASPYQVHSSDVVHAKTPWPKERPMADAIVTDKPGIAIGILTADCGPVLFADTNAGVIGAAHAGWKGALNGVLENTISEMENLGAIRKNIVAVLGPMISQTNYEVGPGFPAPFIEQHTDNKHFFIASINSNHHMFDLTRYIVSRLIESGVEGLTVNRCTYAEKTNFYSYRRATHMGEDGYGCQLSAIVLGEK